MLCYRRAEDWNALPQIPSRFLEHNAEPLCRAGRGRSTQPTCAFACEARRIAASVATPAGAVAEALAFNKHSPVDVGAVPARTGTWDWPRTNHPAASQRAFVLKLVKDRKLPADTRMAVAPKCFRPKPTRSFRTGRPPALAGSRTTIAQEALATAGAAVASKGAQTPAVVPAIRDWNPRALDALFGVVQDRSYRSAEGRRSASEGAFRRRPDYDVLCSRYSSGRPNRFR
jgi:hypothetical protein